MSDVENGSSDDQEWVEGGQKRGKRAKRVDNTSDKVSDKAGLFDLRIVEGPSTTWHALASVLGLDSGKSITLAAVRGASREDHEEAAARSTAVARLLRRLGTLSADETVGAARKRIKTQIEEEHKRGEARARCPNVVLCSPFHIAAEEAEKVELKLLPAFVAAKQGEGKVTVSLWRYGFRRCCVVPQGGSRTNHGASPRREIRRTHMLLGVVAPSTMPS